MSGGAGASARRLLRLREFGVRTETRDVSVESVTRLCLQYDELGRQGLPYASGGRRSEDGRDGRAEVVPNGRGTEGADLTDGVPSRGAAIDAAGLD